MFVLQPRKRGATTRRRELLEMWLAAQAGDPAIGLP